MPVSLGWPFFHLGAGLDLSYGGETVLGNGAVDRSLVDVVARAHLS